MTKTIDTEQQRELKVLTGQSDTLCYMEALADKDLPGLTWTIYGVPDSNLIIVKAIAGSFEILASSPSTVLYPAMADRVFGIDVEDQALAAQLSDQLWATYQQDFEKALQGGRD